jgi:nucleotide-binding universal stress UspA family protein
MCGRATVVVGVDGTAESQAALAYALEDAARRDAALRVVTVFPPLDYWAGAGGISMSSTIAEVQAQVRDHARQMVDRVVADAVRSAAVPVEVESVAGDPAAVLVEQSRDAALLVIGHRGRGRFASAVLGSVGLGCVLHAECPVVVVRPVGVAEPAHATPEAATMARRCADAAVAPMY